MKQSIFKFCFATLVAMFTVGNAFAQDTPPNDEIWYTSTDGKVVTPFNAGRTYFGATIQSNTYTSNKGIIKFNGNVTKLGQRVFFECKKLATVTLPQTITDTIGTSAFESCESLQAITIPDAVNGISEYAFSGCKNLTTAQIGKGVKKVGKYAFYYNEKLISVNLPDSLTILGEAAFCNCSALSTITIPASVTSLGNSLFSRTNLTTVYVCWQTPLPVDRFIFLMTPYTSGTLYVPEGTKTSYSAADVWKNFGTIKEWDATAIEDVNANAKVNALFNLQGQRITSPKKGEIYIQGGKKVISY